MKIVSLVPSITELIVDLGLEENIVGITKFCIHPKRLKSEKNILGGTKNIHIEKIKDLNVDLIIANKEENQKEQIETLLLTENVWVTEIYSLEDNWEFILELGKKTNRFEKAQQMVAEGIKKWNVVKDLFSKKKVLYFIWQNPYMSIGKNTFIHSVLSHLGMDSVTTNLNGNYPLISEDWIKNTAIELVLFSSEPFPFKETHLIDFKVNFSHLKTLLIDGEMCSWYGSRMLLAPNYFMNLKTMNKLH